MDLNEFLKNVSKIYRTGSATEHSYRADLQKLLSSIDRDTTALNEPKRVKCGAPDFIVTHGDIVIGHVEAKKVPKSIRNMNDSNKAQQRRYLAALPNLVYTNCLDWDFYCEGSLKESVSIADIHKSNVRFKPDQFTTLENLLRNFITQRPQTITSPKELAERMAGKASLIKDVLQKTLTDKENPKSELVAQFSVFRRNLIHDIKKEDFADIYAETIAYGMFAARLHDKTRGTPFSRQKALELLPKSNPFLRALFTYIAGYDLDNRIAWIIDDLADVFQACNVAKLMEGFGRLTGQNDPFLHFYESFLAAYNPDRRKLRGVWYTPEPVVNFIVRAVDEVLQTEFGLVDGLADTSKVTINWDTGQTTRKDKPFTISKEVHRVQILDPATGTGTFLAEAIKQIESKVQGIAPGMWSHYIEDDLIPRLHGFELLMASYAMCHMKLDMILTEMGYKPSRKPPRLSVYLTNSLEKGELIHETLPFSQWLSQEAEGANSIKRNMPIMCVIGNPPYLGASGVAEGWLGNLMDDYKKEPGGKKRLKERNPRWLNDLYVKFIRLSSYLIEKNGEGVLGFITNHGYLDNPTFRGMRWHLLKTFDRIWILDLHGNVNKQEVTPEGNPDKNVFDIQQGVSIIIGVKKKGVENGLAEVMHGDLWGEREGKYEMLRNTNVIDPLFSPLECPSPQHPFVKRDFSIQKSYEKGFAINEFMPVNSVGIVTSRDSLTIDESKEKLWERVKDFAALTPEEARQKYRLKKDVQDWKMIWAQKDLNCNLSHNKLTRISYRPFDMRWTYYTGKSRGFICRPRTNVMRHMLHQNFALATARSNKNPLPDHFFVVETVMEAKCAESSTQSALFPLYLYPDEQDLVDQTRRINFDLKLFKRLQKLAKHPTHGMPDEVDVFDYIYGVLHCVEYRRTYAEFLKIDFPRIQWPITPDEFWDVSAKGTALRRLHLMEPKAIGSPQFPFMGEGDRIVGKPDLEDGKVWINKTQYFDNVSEVSWGFTIGGYQPAQKWLKARKGRPLSFDDVKHYQHTLKILSETDQIMRTIKMSLEYET